MKKTTSILLVLFLFLSVFCMIPVSAEDADTQKEPVDYIAIKSESDFLAMKADGAYYLTNDITVSSSYENEFSGTLHGNENEIKISNNATPFKKLNGATITDLTVSGSISLSKNETRGGIANEGSATFKNVINEVDISAASSLTTLVKSIGGFIGYVDATSSFINCTNNGTINILSQEANSVNVIDGFGGFVGSAFVSDQNSIITFDGCNNNAEIYSTQYGMSVGGFIGHTSNISITMIDCVNAKAITGSAYYNTPAQYHKGIGGVLGSVEANANPNAKIILTNLENKGNIHGIEELSMTGGIIGMIRDCLSITLNGCKNSGAISCERSVWEGGAGILGFLSSSTPTKITFTECSNSGHIKAFEAAGILGFVQNVTKNSTFIFDHCYNTGKIESTSQYAGGIAGHISSDGGTLSISKCVNAGHVEVLTSSGGGAGGIIGSIDYLASTAIERCVNAGSIRCNNNSYAAGIVSRLQNATAKVANCVNAGTTSHASKSQNCLAICYNDTSLGHSLLLNSYSHNTGNGIVGAIPYDFNIIAETVVSTLMYSYSASDYHSFNGIDSANEAIKKTTNATELGNATIALISKLNDLQTNDEYLASAKQEKLEELGEKRFFTSDLYTAKNYKNYSKAFDEIKLSITSAENVENLKAIKIKDKLLLAEVLLLTSDDSNEQGNITDGNDTTDEKDTTDGKDTTGATDIIDTDETTTTTDVIDATDTEETAPATTNQKIQKGCNSSISSIAIIIFTLLIGCVAISFKRKKA